MALKVNLQNVQCKWMQPLCDGYNRMESESYVKYKQQAGMYARCHLKAL